VNQQQPYLAVGGEVGVDPGSGTDGEEPLEEELGYYGPKQDFRRKNVEVL